MQDETNEKITFAKIRLFEAIGKLSVNGIGLSTTFLTSSGIYLASTKHQDVCRAFNRMRHLDHDILIKIHHAGQKSYRIKQPYIHRFGILWYVSSAIEIKEHECTLSIGPFANKSTPLLPADIFDFSMDTGISITQVNDWMSSLIQVDQDVAMHHAKTLADITKMLLEELYNQNHLETQLTNHQEYIKHLLFERNVYPKSSSSPKAVLPHKNNAFIFEKEYLGHIQAGNKEMANKLVNDVLNDLSDKTHKDLDFFKANAYELLANLIRAAVHSGVSNDVMTEVIDKHYQIMKHETQYEEINLMISEATNTLSDAIYQIKGNSPGRGHLSKAILYIRNHYQKHISLDDVAQVCDISSYYLSHLFRDEMETTYIEYVNKVRLEEAKKMLQSGEYTIYQTAFHCGFRDPGYFSKTFKKYLGISPRKYQHMTKK